MSITKGVSIGLCSLALVAGSAFAGQEDRRAGMKAIGKAAKAISSGGDVAANANIIIAEAKAVPAKFDANEIMGDSTAIALIWEQFDDFTAKAGDLEMAAMAVLAAAESGGDVGAAAKAMGGTCGACHKMYREKK